MAELEAALAEDAPVLAQAQETWLHLSTLQERLRATHQLATERSRHLATEVEEERPGRDPDQLEAEAEELREQERTMREALDADQHRLNLAVESRQQMERRLTDAERALVAAVKAIADRREGLAQLVGQVNALRTRATAAAEEIARLEAAFVEAQTRAFEAQEAYEIAADGATEADRGTAELDDRHEVAVAAADEIAARLKELNDAERAAERDATVEGPRRGAGHRPAPQGRRRCAAGPGRSGARPARLRGRPAHRRVRVRGRAGRRARRGRRRGRGVRCGRCARPRSNC